MLELSPSLCKLSFYVNHFIFSDITFYDHFIIFICSYICAQAYNLKLKLSLINLSNEQNKYLTL